MSIQVIQACFDELAVFTYDSTPLEQRAALESINSFIRLLPPTEETRQKANKISEAISEFENHKITPTQAYWEIEKQLLEMAEIEDTT
ncbi:MAG: hypothetical protein N4A74_07520 [Carboxylicivirga sp.]|jgi:hypothetical protein|nr:hypothetical protein [Carboxylicivirga sp.]